MKRIFLTFSIIFCLFAITYGQTDGELNAFDKKGKAIGDCPLKQTTVKAEISGFLSRVRVTQEFENKFNEPIEAVYVFPLPNNSAVDDMTMKIGERTIRGKILKRDEAKQVYENARNNGQSASLLDQERPNIFTQSVANILPNEKITIEISYVENLKYEDGSYEFVFPMVVGPRYKPASMSTEQKQAITPPVATKTRAGHDISVEITLDAGVPIEEIRSTSHEIETLNLNSNSANIKLKAEKVIPNKDFILRYDVSGKKINDAILTHSNGKGGYFSLILQPPDKIESKDVSPKEIVFVVDTSGSMHGFPLDKAKESMKMALDGLYPNDTFNLITFAGDTHVLFDKPVPATKGNLEKAQAFLDGQRGGGGTEMMKAIKASLAPSDSQSHLRIVCFMTDGYVGNEGEILSEIKKHQNARVFSFGIGSSVNRFLLDKMAEEGRGEVQYVTLQDDGTKAAKNFHERIRNPLLTDISIDWNGMEVADVYPKRQADLFSAKPLVIYGRYTKSGSGTIKLKGKFAGAEIVREIPVNFAENATGNNVLATLWARTRIDDLMSNDYNSVAQNGKTKPEIEQTITQLGLEYRLMTQFTSFVAVEEKIVNQNGKPVRVDVPVELPEGVSDKAIQETADLGNTLGTPSKQKNAPAVYTPSNDPHGYIVQGYIGRRKDRSSSGQGSGSGNGRGSGSGNVSVNGGVNGSVSGNRSSQSTITLDGVDVKTDEKSSKVLTEKEKKLEIAKNKLHSWVYDLVERLSKNTSTPTANEAYFVKDGKAEISITLNDKSSVAIIEKLKKLGFEVTSENQTIVIGKIAIEKISSLAEIEEVKFILPNVK
ncbi:MAG: VWA domain-containing protein [Pyrinomonadaceae bacterium]|jgi:Ca-activated chloride channel family protein|nr:VWA domain-containing protein [Pyrinomonadaceae bacterium]